MSEVGSRALLSLRPPGVAATVCEWRLPARREAGGAVAIVPVSEPRGSGDSDRGWFHPIDPALTYDSRGGLRKEGTVRGRFINVYT